MQKKDRHAVSFKLKFMAGNPLCFISCWIKIQNLAQKLSGSYEYFNMTSLFYTSSSLKIEDFESQGLVASSQPVFVRLLLAIYHALMSHSDMVCYFAVFILQIKSPTLASLPLSLMVLFWGTLSIPRPTKRFWVTIIAYTEVKSWVHRSW